MADRTRDRGTHAPMDFVWERERDPGVFTLPAKRQHIETAEGRSSWAPAPYASFGTAPLLFDTSSAMQVDSEPPHILAPAEINDVDMAHADSPAEAPAGHEVSKPGPSLLELGASLPAPDSVGTAKAADAPRPQPLASGSGSVAHRAMNTAAVRKVAKARKKETATAGSGLGKENEAHAHALVLHDEAHPDDSDDTHDEGTPKRLRRRTNAAVPSRSHLGSASASATAQTQSLGDGPRYSSHMNSGNSYTLNVFGNPEKGGESAHERRLEPTKIGVSHSDMPYIALGYVQFVFNAAIVCFCIYLGGIFIWTIRQDIKERARAQESELLAEIFSCNYLFGLNRCEPSTRIPAMEAQCNEWEQCGQRDPKAVGRAKVGAEMFAGVISGFVDELSWKTIFFLLFSLTCLVFIANSALFSMRARHVAQYHPGVYAPYPPPDPLGHHAHAHGMDPQLQRHQFEWPPAPDHRQAVGEAPDLRRSDGKDGDGKSRQGFLGKLGLS